MANQGSGFIFYHLEKGSNRWSRFIFDCLKNGSNQWSGFIFGLGSWIRSMIIIFFQSLESKETRWLRFIGRVGQSSTN
jgi:hypothetical protein